MKNEKVEFFDFAKYNDSTPTFSTEPIMPPKFAAVFFLVLYALCPVQAIEDASEKISGPDFSTCGNLVVFELPEPADWCIIPLETTAGRWAVDPTGRTFYFASSEAGQYTICAAVLVEGKPKLLTKPFVNRPNVAPSPEPSPGPVPPVPEPEHLAGWVRSKTNELTGSASFEREKNAIADCVQSILNGIELGTIRSPAAARGVLRQCLAGRLAAVSPASPKIWASFLEQLGGEIEKRSKEHPDELLTLKALFSELIRGLRE